MMRLVLMADQSLIDENCKNYPPKEHCYRHIFFGRLINNKIYLPNKFDHTFKAIIYLLQFSTALNSLHKIEKGQELSANEIELKNCEFLIGLIKQIEDELHGEYVHELSRVAEVSPLYNNIIEFFSTFKKN